MLRSGFLFRTPPLSGEPKNSAPKKKNSAPKSKKCSCGMSKKHFPKHSNLKTLTEKWENIPNAFDLDFFLKEEGYINRVFGECRFWDSARALFRFRCGIFFFRCGIFGFTSQRCVIKKTTPEHRFPWFSAIFSQHEKEKETG